jgi:hypothetical protein
VNRPRWKSLKVGDTLRHVQTGTRYVVTGIRRGAAGRILDITLARTITASDHSQWSVIPEKERKEIDNV